MKSIGKLMAILLLLSSSNSFAEIRNSATATFKIAGSCALCKSGIETAAMQKNVSRAEWNEHTQMALITYDTQKTSADAVLKKIALAGYDNPAYLAPDDAYAKLAACCQYERMNKHKMKSDTPPHHDMAVHTTEDHSATQKTAVDGDPLALVLSSYYAVKDALVSSDGSAASAGAADLVKAIKAVKMEELPSEQHMVWMKVMKDLDFDADHISETKDVGHQRDHFSSLSENMYKLIRAGKPSEAVYYQHCPMAKEGKGANWLSQTSTVKNPYFGAQMLNCGKTTETIK